MVGKRRLLEHPFGIGHSQRSTRPAPPAAACASADPDLSRLGAKQAGNRLSRSLPTLCARAAPDEVLAASRAAAPHRQLRIPIPERGRPPDLARRRRARQRHFGLKRLIPRAAPARRCAKTVSGAAPTLVVPSSPVRRALLLRHDSESPILDIHGRLHLLLTPFH
jgi:hypothetical protein